MGNGNPPPHFIGGFSVSADKNSLGVTTLIRPVNTGQGTKDNLWPMELINGTVGITRQVA